MKQNKEDKIEVSFTLYISGRNSADVCPIKPDNSPHLKFLMDSLQDTLYIEEDLATSFVEVSSMNELLIALDCFTKKDVTLSISSMVKHGSFSATACLDDVTHAWTRTSINNEVSVSQGIQQIVAICQAMSKTQQGL